MALVVFGPVLGLPAVSLAQDATDENAPIQLDTVTLEGQGGKAVGPDASIVAERSATGSKTDTPILDLPAAVSVVTEEELEKRNAQNLDEALAYTAGVSTDEYGSDDRYDYYRIRGFYQTGQGTYRDGLPMRLYGFTGSRIEPYGMQRIEVLKGSTSTLFGLNAPGGLVNAITKRPQSTKFGEVYTTVGDEHVETGADFGGSIDAAGDWSYRLTTKWQDGDNNADFTNDDRFYVAPALTWSPSDATSLTILGDYNKRDGNTSHAIPLGSGLDPKTYLGEPDFDAMDTVEKNIGYQFSHDFGNGLQFRQNARYTDLDLTYESVYGATADITAGRSAWAVYGEAQRFGIDSQLQYDASYGRIDSRTLVGMDYGNDKTSEYRVFGSAAGIDIFNPSYCGRDCIILPPGYTWNNHQTAQGVYVQEELTLDKRWILTLGGRYDHVRTQSDMPEYGLSYDVTDDAFTKRAGLTYKITDGISVYTNYSESFEPTAADRSSLVGDPEPQEGRQYEVGAKYRPEGLDALFTVALFDLTQTNVPYSISTTTQSQIGEVNVRGLELEGKMAMTDRLNMTLAYSFWNSEIVEDGIGTAEGNRPYLVPEHLASVWADYTIPESDHLGDLTLGLGVRFVGSSFTDNENTIKIDSHTLVDAAIKYAVTESTQLSVNATNLFDEEYIASVNTYENSAYYGDGRAVRATLKYTW
ncbi:ligand-gated channel protein [Aureimonas sp. SA4125]|nr:ligand-gated channel protein [Aureimonas sp. SA4125]